MRYAQPFQPGRRYSLRGVGCIAAILLVASVCGAQAKPEGPAPGAAAIQEMNAKYPGLWAEFGRLFERLQKDVQTPEPRSESRLLSLLPEATMSCGAFPNYGDAAHQALKVFRQELQESAVLRDWWQHGEVASAGAKVEDSLEKFYQLSQYLGDEIVVSGTMEGREPKLLMVAEVRKPGLKKFLQQTVNELAGKSKPGVRVLDPQELATAKDGGPPEELTLLVRPDFVVGALDLATLRTFNARLDHNTRGFPSTPFGQRIAQGYAGGVTVLAAADLHKIMSQVPPVTPESQKTFQATGFADMKYLVWEHKKVGGQGVSQSELSFVAPRHGAASWLAKPAPLGSLDFVSPKAMMAGTTVLTSPAQIFEDIKELESISNPNAFAALAPAEQALKLSLKDDLLRYLAGEITVELDSVTPPNPEWRAILKVTDPSRLQQTLSTLLGVAHIAAESFDEGGITHYTLKIPSAQTSVEIGYAFVDGYLIVASGREAVAEAVRLHKSGTSLGKSKKFLASQPPGHSPGASALFYQDPLAMAAMQLRQASPDMAASLAQLAGESTPAAIYVYGEEKAIREASTSNGLDAGVVLVVAAIAIPNLLRAKIAANESSAVGSVRTVNTAQVAYVTMYPQKGYAPNLATLGTVHSGPKAGYNAESPEHAGLIDETLANESCTADAWCTKSGFKFRVASLCKQHSCKEYVVLATPVDSNMGTRSFCSTSDGVIHSKAGPPLTSPVGVAECKAWPPLQ
jgi:type II secretory pathway pseudopilin PulG